MLATMMLLGFVCVGGSIWFMFSNDKNFEHEEFTSDTVYKHEVKTAGSLFFTVLGGYLLVFAGVGMFLRFLFTPW